MASRSKGGPGRKRPPGRPPTLGYKSKPASKVSPLAPYEANERQSSSARSRGHMNPYERGGLNLWCQECGEVFNGPSKGKYAHTNDEKAQIEKEGTDINPMGGLTGSVCGRKSCISSHVNKTVLDDLRRRHPDRDYTEVEARMLETEYDYRRSQPERYPGGLIDDVAPPVDEGFGDE